jgi:3-oxoacyl-[acyl-carrier-protein] synthase II/nodulation protein E
MRDVVVSGIGIVGPQGIGVEALIAGTGSAAPAFAPWPSGQEPPNAAARIANVAEYPKTRYFTERQLRLMDRAMSMSSCAAGLALEDADFNDRNAPKNTATFLGTSRAEAPAGYNFIAPLLPGNSGRLNGADFPMIARNISCGQIAIRFGLQGPSSVMASGSIASLEAIARAFNFVRCGRADVALAGGFEVLSKFSLYLARHYYGKALAERSPQFFGLNPGFLVPSEGACILVLEAGDHARSRGARTYARVDGWRAGRFGRGDASAALLECWTALLDSLGREDERLGLISASSGGSNRPHELAEREALAAFFRARPVEASVCAPRSLVGEGEAWASALQVALCAYLLGKRQALPTWSLAADAPTAIASRAGGGLIAGDGALVSGLDPNGAYGALHLSCVE